MKNFGEFLNEDWEDDYKEAGITNYKAFGFSEPEWPYEDKVRKRWLTILCEENFISEKDFQAYEMMKKRLDDLIKALVLSGITGVLID